MGRGAIPLVFRVVAVDGPAAGLAQPDAVRGARARRAADVFRVGVRAERGLDERAERGGDARLAEAPVAVAEDDGGGRLGGAVLGTG